MIVVSNSSPLIAFAKIEALHLLQELFGKVLISPEVFSEVAIDGVGRAGALEIFEFSLGRSDAH